MTHEKGLGEISREDFAAELKWNLKDMFASDSDWRRAKEETAAELSSLDSFKGKLAESPARLREALDLYFRLEKEIERLGSYAVMLSDQDTRQSGPMAMKQEMVQLKTDLRSRSAYIGPEILHIPRERMMEFLAEEAALKVYDHFLDDIYRRKEHTLSEAEEKVVAEAGLMAETPYEVHTILSNADLPYRTVKLSDGREVRVDATNYTLHRTSPNRGDRIAVFDAFFGALKGFERTFGAQLFGEVRKNLFYRGVRRYGTSLESALDRNAVPVEVYHSLIRNVNDSLPCLHRYLNLRRRLLQLDELHYYDLYTSMVKGVDLKYTYQEARSTLLKALAPLGSSYTEMIDRAFLQCWIDACASTGKRSGAYCDAVYDVHPYILMSFNGKYEDVSTLAHELGHAMHSHFSNTNQAYVNSKYPIFLAEVASTVNESLLVDYELGRAADKDQKIALLGGYLEGYRTTLFRQTQFAEFELRIHERAEKGEALTGEDFTALYLEILRKYYGQDRGICSIKDLYGVEWAYIPHFYYNFYVFQYSTSFTAAQAIAAKILGGDTEAVGRYLDFLKSGGSDYPIPTLRKVGIDMTGSDPFNLTMRRANQVMDEIEGLIE